MLILLPLVFCVGPIGTAAIDAEDGVCAAGSGCMSQLGLAYPWGQRAGSSGNGASKHIGPRRLLTPAWQWKNPEEELFRHAPVLDNEANIYAATANGRIRKFSPSGAELWMWETSPSEGKMVTSPFLYEGQLFITSMGEGPSAGTATQVYSFDMATGKQNWKRPGPRGGRVNSDSNTIYVANGTIIGAMIDDARPPKNDGNNRVYAMSVATGAHMWDFVLDEGNVWNFMPVSPGDGTLLFSTACGVGYRLDLATGSLIWRADLPETGMMCGTGGGTLGPNGVFYAEAVWFPVADTPAVHRWRESLPPCTQENGCPQGLGALIAYNVADGSMRWAKRFGHYKLFGHQYPAVAVIAGRLTVIAGVGRNPAFAQYHMGPAWLPEWLRYSLQEWQLKVPLLRKLFGIDDHMEGIITYDADTGRELWRWYDETWDFLACAGDEDGIHGRIARAKARPYGPTAIVDPRFEVICGPDNWGIPTVGADGTIYASSGNNGYLHAIRDDDGNGIIEAAEVSTYKTGSAFLNGPALSQGMLVAAPCWGPMLVFKGDGVAV